MDFSIRRRGYEEVRWPNKHRTRWHGDFLEDSELDTARVVQRLSSDVSRTWNRHGCGAISDRSRLLSVVGPAGQFVKRHLGEPGFPSLSISAFSARLRSNPAKATASAQRRMVTCLPPGKVTKCASGS